jgi:polyhydroxyalkanoate synthesis repressor PhaR
VRTEPCIASWAQPPGAARGARFDVAGATRTCHIEENAEKREEMAVVASQSRKKGDDGPVVIKKYANRRLYNTAKSSYVTLEDLSRMVRAGEEFEVFDAKTGEDITRSVLTQIIFEEEAKEGQNMLPTNFLRQIIRLYGDTMQSVVPGYLDAAMETFARNQERMREAMGGNQAMATFEKMARSNMEWFEQTMKMFGQLPGRGEPGAQPGAGAGEGGAAPAQDVSEDIDRLQRQLAEVKAQLDRLTPDTETDAAEPGEEAGAEPPRAAGGTGTGTGGG